MKKRINGEGSIRKRKNGTWEARITIGFDESTGKQVTKSVYGRSQKEIKCKLESLLGDKIQKSCDEAELTLSKWLDEWIKDFVVDVKSGTVESYECICRNHIKPILGNIPLVELKAPVIQKFYNGLRAKGLSAKYIKNIHGTLHRALDMAVRIDYLSKNPTSACVIPKVTQKEIKPLDLPDQKKLFAALDGAYYGPLFIVAIFTGMRVGELIGLEWDCIDFENGIIHVNKQLVQTRKKGQEYQFGSLKNGKTRTVAPAQYVIDVLADHKIDQEIEKARAKDLWKPGNFPNLVFTHPDGSHLSQPTVWKEFQKILQSAGLDHYRVHDLRHTFAVNSIIAGDDIKTLQENMGHYSAAFTLDRYGHVTDSMKKASASRMQVFIENLQNV